MGKWWFNQQKWGLNGIYSWEKSMKIIDANYVKGYWIDKWETKAINLKMDW
jgi:hypothetical protein